MRSAWPTWPARSTSPARPIPTPCSRSAWSGRALLHEIGYTVSHIGFHKHGAYILENADMPGFSAQEQRYLAMLVLGCRGGLSKLPQLAAHVDLAAQVLALRLAVLFHHARRPIEAPRIALQRGQDDRFRIAARWLKEHPLTAHLLDLERAEWRSARRPWKA